MDENEENATGPALEAAEFPARFKEILDDYGKGREVDWVSFNLILKNARFISKITVIQAYALATIRGYIEILPERRFIVKELPEIPDNCAKLAFINESYAYAELLPTLEKFSPNAEIQRPETIHISDTLLIFNDLTFDNYDHFHKLDGYSVPVVHRVLKEIAHFHSASLIMRHENPDDFEILVDGLTEVFFNDTEKNDMKPIIDSQERALETALNLLENEENPDEKALKILRDLKGNAFTLQKSVIERERAPVKAITHGDLWNNNFLSNDATQDFKFIDFQAMRYTSIAADLSYFLYVNLDPDFRLANLNAFLEFYLSELVDFCAGKCPVDQLTFPVLEAEMAEFKIFGLVSGAWVLPAFYENVDDDDRVNPPSPERLAALAELKNDRLVRLVKSCVDGATVTAPFAPSAGFRAALPEVDVMDALSGDF